MPLVPPKPARITRTCATCACFYQIPNPQNPLEQQSFCGLKPPLSSMVRVEVPRLDAQGKPVMSKLDPKKPATNTVQDIGFAHAPTHPELFCFDGYRRKDVRPGERASDYRLRQAFKRLQPIIARVIAGGGDAQPQELLATLEELVDGADDPQAAAAEDPPEALNS